MSGRQGEINENLHEMWPQQRKLILLETLKKVQRDEKMNKFHPGTLCKN